MLSEAELRSLDEDGYLAIPGLMPPDLLKALRCRTDELFDAEGANAGSEFKQEPGARRLANLVNKGQVFEEMIVNPLVLECAARVLGPRFKLSSLNARSTDPWWPSPDTPDASVHRSAQNRILSVRFADGSDG